MHVTAALLVALPTLPTAVPLASSGPPARCDVGADAIPIAARTVARSVVGVTAVQRLNEDDEDEDAMMMRLLFGQRPRAAARVFGTGIALEPHIVITSAHVVADATHIEVELPDHKKLPARVMGADDATDIAVLRVDGGDGELAPVAVGSSDSLEVGQLVVSVSNPFGIGTTATFGIVSALERGGLGLLASENFIQTDAAINPGSSGGALVDLCGRLVGIDTAIVSSTGQSQNIGFAVPQSVISAVVPRLVADGRVRRGSLDLDLQEGTPALLGALGLQPRATNAHRLDGRLDGVDGARDVHGVVVADVRAGGAGARAGIVAGDVIVAADDKPAHTVHDVENEAAVRRPGEPVTLVVVRHGRNKRVVVTLAERKTAVSHAAPAGKSSGPGLTLADLDPALREGLEVPDDVKSGAVVASVDVGSRADDAGLERGDVVVSADDAPIANAHELERVLSSGKETPVMLRVVRAGKHRFAVIDAHP